MSGLAVIVRRDGAPIERSVVHAVASSLAHRGPDGVTVIDVDGVVFVHAALHATPEAVRERHPLRLRAGNLVADVRIDDRVALLASLRAGGGGAVDTSSTDLELLGAALEQWGVDAAHRIVGDFAAVLVRSNGSIVALRDQLGVKPLYYWVDERWAVFGSELRTLAAHPDCSREIDVGVAGEFLSGEVSTATATLLAGVHRLPGGHRLELRAGGRPAVSRYWEAPLVSEERTSPADAEERCRELFVQAVHSRCRTRGAVAVELSGGLDSTAVAACAAAAVRDGIVVATAASTFSCIFEGDARSDERRFIDAAAREIGVPWAPISTPPGGGDAGPWLAESAEFWHDVPIPPDGPSHVRLGHAARAVGAPVVLTGHGGDHLFIAAQRRLLETLELDGWRRAWSQLASACGGDRSRTFRRLLALRLGPDHPLIARRRPPRAPWVTGAARTNIAVRPERRRRQRRSDLARARIVSSGYQAMYLEMLDRTGAAAGVELRHPFLDRRLVEYVLGLRADVVDGDPDVDRTLQRRALAPFLPEIVLTRTDKASFAGVWRDEIRRHVPANGFRDTLPASRGWIDELEAEALLRELEDAMAADGGNFAASFGLWGILTIDAFLRGHQGV